MLPSHPWNAINPAAVVGIIVGIVSVVALIVGLLVGAGSLSSDSDATPVAPMPDTSTLKPITEENFSELVVGRWQTGVASQPPSAGWIEFAPRHGDPAFDLTLFHDDLEALFPDGVIPATLETATYSFACSSGYTLIWIDPDGTVRTGGGSETVVGCSGSDAAQAVPAVVFARETMMAVDDAGNLYWGTEGAAGEFTRIQ
ncbi:MAG: hypothetical protein SPI77_08695 [Corynebacterium sp.]|nr:hypothetical protein [Corynebacterium sp.]